MCVYIGIEDLVANALIELIEQKNQREVLFKDLDKYGAMVIKCLNEEGYEEAVLLLSKERTDAFLHDYTDYFELYTDDNDVDEGIRLKPEITAERLWEIFRCYLSADVLEAFMNDEAVSLLGVVA